MCFSTKASFASAGFLTIIGAALIHKTWRNKKLLPFASTPFWFGIQQASEGFVWLGIAHNVPSSVYTTAMYSFVFFAGCWWPTWAPVTLYILEKNSLHKRLLLITIVIGIITSIIYFISLIFHPMSVLVTQHHLYYPTLSYPLRSTNTITQCIENSIPIIYFFSTVIPAFISSIKYMSILGLVMGGACLTSQIFFTSATASVWCFFAAIASVLICLIVKTYQKNN